MGFGIVVEMSDLVGIVLLVTIGAPLETVQRLVDALAVLATDYGPTTVIRMAPSRSAGEVTGPGDQVLSPREAFFARTRPVRLEEAVGEVAAELVVPYPPGIPVLALGERVSAAKARYLSEVAARGTFICGSADPT